MMDWRTVRAFARAFPRPFAAAVAEAVREVTRSTPAPRGLPFFGIDLPEGCGERLLDRLCDLGIFRVYERVLDLGGGLGGAARWLVRRRGCRVTTAAGDRETASASALLTRRAHLAGSASIFLAAADRLAVADAAFTHAWSVEALGHVDDKAACLREVFRAVRPGGHVALQEWVATVADTPGPPRPAPLDAWTEALCDAGFVDVKASDVGDAREADESAIGEILRERITAILGEPGPEEGRAVEELLARVATRDAATADGRLRLFQIFAARPS